MSNVFQYLPDVDAEELPYIDMLMKTMSESQANQFAMIYRSRRKDPQMILLLTLVGFLGFAGIQRFVLGQIGMGIVYFLTFGFCYIGVIIDLVNYRKLASEYNQKQAYEVAVMMKSMQA